MGILRGAHGCATGAWVIAFFAVAACGGRDSASRGPYAREVARAIPTVERQTGLRFKRPPAVQERSRAQVRQFLERDFRRENADSTLAAQEIALQRLGLISDSVNLRRLMLDLLTEQVAGYYDPATDTLYIVQGAPQDQVSVVVTHELVHALQDQYFNLDSLEQLTGDDDRQLAAQAVMEGQATLVMVGGDLASRLPGGWEMMRQQIRQSQSSAPVFAAAPGIIQELLLFPYLSGAQFVSDFVSRRPGTPPFERLPASTEQILRSAAYFAPTPDLPTRIALPAPSAGTAVYDNVMGEFATRVFVYDQLQDQPLAVRAAAGWDGDRYAVLRFPGGGNGIVWASVWDSPADAAEFYDALRRIVARRYGRVAPVETAPQNLVYTVAGRRLTVWGGQLGGRPGVVYSDVPSEITRSVLDPARITLEPEPPAASAAR